MVGIHHDAVLDTGSHLLLAEIHESTVSRYESQDQINSAKQ